MNKKVKLSIIMAILSATDYLELRKTILEEDLEFEELVRKCFAPKFKFKIYKTSNPEIDYLIMTSTDGFRKKGFFLKPVIPDCI